jgi:hypothetical protein
MQVVWDGVASLRITRIFRENGRSDSKRGDTSGNGQDNNA